MLPLLLDPGTIPGTRREFLRSGGGLAVASYALGGPLRGETSSGNGRPQTGAARSCILVYLLGGPPHLDMWDPKPDAPAEIRGPFRPIATSVAGLMIGEHLPRLAGIAHRFAIVRSVSHPNHNHTPMIYYTLTGRPVEQPGQDNDVRPPLRTDFPCHGAVLSRFKPNPEGLPGHIALPELAVRSSVRGEFKRARERLRGGGAGFLGPLHDPLSINGEPGESDAIPALSLPGEVTLERLERRAELLGILDPALGSTIATGRTHDLLQHKAVVLSGAAGEGQSRVFSLESEPASLRDRYGRHRFEKSMLLARRLAESGVPMISIHFNEMTLCDGWDLHTKNHEGLKEELLPMLDQSLSALLTDLSQRGLLDQTLVVVMGEFGRTPRINKQAGRDHWGSCSSTLMAGGGIRGGLIHGSSDKLGAFPTSDPVDPVDIQATLYHCMGLDPERIIRDSLQRPFSICTGRVIESLVGTA